MAKALMFVGTASESGKSVMAAAFCRILEQQGIQVAPFKAQNMALNSFITRDGKEMGRAQVVQAEAAGIEPHVDMNPILLKPTSEKGSQVIVHGVVRENMDASRYYALKRTLWPCVTESYDRLSRHYECIVLEGAGSPVEMNLKDSDIVNMTMAEYADARVVLVADIDRGGVFASIVGTTELLEAKERERLIGFIINKFRGDEALLREGLQFIEHKTGRPVLGVVPYMRDLYIPGEDSVSLERKSCLAAQPERTGIPVGIIRLPHISNYTDFDPLEADARFNVAYVTEHARLDCYDAIILPGSKNVFYDLRFLQSSGMTEALKNYYVQGGKIVGICGGYQMLGHSIKDPHGVEDNGGEMHGLDLLPVCSVMAKDKVTVRVRCLFALPGEKQAVAVDGYEIHMGRTVPAATDVSYLRCDEGKTETVDVARRDGRVWGTYLHGLFENDVFRDSFLQWITGRATAEQHNRFSYAAFKQSNYDRLASVVKKHVNTSYILQQLGLPSKDYKKQTICSR